jgi:hypothetical protein
MEPVGWPSAEQSSKNWKRQKRKHMLNSSKKKSLKKKDADLANCRL